MAEKLQLFKRVKMFFEGDRLKSRWLWQRPIYRVISSPRLVEASLDRQPSHESSPFTRRGERGWG